MDGNFVPNITFGPDVVLALRKYSHLPFHLHLMINKPEQFIESFVKAGADLIVLHLESLSDAKGALALIKSFNISCGISIKPQTSEHELFDLLPMLDQVLVMSVNPGFSGQAFLSNQLPKIHNISKQIKTIGKEIDLCVDGGINAKTAPQVINNGATNLVAGSYLFASKDEATYQSQIKKLVEMSV
jgi:ribulose-phosphate 3-epimerase